MTEIKCRHLFWNIRELVARSNCALFPFKEVYFLQFSFTVTSLKRQSNNNTRSIYSIDQTNLSQSVYQVDIPNRWKAE